MRAEGYTIRSIHQALAEAGVEVGWSTVQREAARLAKPSTATKTDQQRPTMPAATPAFDPAGASPRASRGAAVEVDSYFDTHNTNPLFKRKGSKA